MISPSSSSSSQSGLFLLTNPGGRGRSAYQGVKLRIGPLFFLKKKKELEREGSIELRLPSSETLGFKKVKVKGGEALRSAQLVSN